MILNDEQMRAISFIAFVNRGGYRPTGREINEWRRRPDPKPKRKGKLLEAEVPAVPERRVRIGGESPFVGILGGAGHKAFNPFGDSLPKYLSDIGAEQLAGLNSAALQAVRAAALPSAWMLSGGKYETTPGKPGKPAIYGPDKPPEKFLAHLRRLGWIQRDLKGGGYAVTLLGHSLLRSETASEVGDDESSVMVLAADDELAYGRVIGIIAECGDAFIMDAYLGIEELTNILNHTSASRFLVGNKLSKSRRTELAMRIQLMQPGPNGSKRELRQAELHDRYVVGDHKLYGLGSSINGVGGKSMTTLVEMPDVAARVLRAAAEELWDSATSIAVTGQVAASSNSHASGDSEDREVAQQEDGRFVHEGCPVRHKKKLSAENCTNGS